MLFRTARLEDADSMRHVLQRAFNLESQEAKLAAWMRYIERRPEEWKVLEVDRQMVGVLSITRDWLRVGEAIISKGDVGHVAILPDYQGRGLGTELMKRAVEWMRANDFDLSRLGGLARFYARFGWKRFPRRCWEFAFRAEKAGASVREPRAPAIPGDAVQHILPFDREADWEKCKHIKEQFERSHSGSPVHPSPSVGASSLVFRQNGQVLGYISLNLDQEEISDVAYDRARPDVFRHLVAAALGRALAAGVNRLTARLPFDPGLAAILADINVPFQWVETYGGHASNMLQVINLGSLCRNLVPELEKRLRPQTPSARLGLDIGKQGVTLDIREGKVAIREDLQADVVLRIDEALFLRMVLGLSSFAEMRSAVPLREAGLLERMFPGGIVYSGNWG